MFLDRALRLLLLAIVLQPGCATLHKPPNGGANDLAATAPVPQSAPDKTLVEQFREELRAKPDPDAAKARYQSAENLFHNATQLSGDQRREQFMQAAKEYTAAARAWPATALAEDALLMSAEAYYFADRYPKASARYDELIKTYPSSRHLDRIDQRRFEIAQYWLGRCGEKGGHWLDVNMSSTHEPTNDAFGHAVRLLDRIRFDNPTGKLADDATMAAAVANFRRGKYYDADVLFTDIRENFPRSEHQFRAHFLGLKCKQKLYRGSDYDGSVLRDAEQIVHQTIRLFPQEAEKHREELNTELKDIRLKQAERDFVMAKFFDGRKEYGAARYYYDMVRREYGDTSLAFDSESRLAQIDGLPEVPESSLQWLIDRIPEEEPSKPLIARETASSSRR